MPQIIAGGGIVTPVPLPLKSETLNIRVATEDLDAWRAAAERERMTLSDWIRRACFAAVPTKPMKKVGT